MFLAFFDRFLCALSRIDIYENRLRLITLHFHGAIAVSIKDSFFPRDEFSWYTFLRDRQRDFWIRRDARSEIYCAPSNKYCLLDTFVNGKAQIDTKQALPEALWFYANIRSEHSIWMNHEAARMICLVFFSFAKLGYRNFIPRVFQCAMCFIKWNFDRSRTISHLRFLISLIQIITQYERLFWRHLKKFSHIRETHSTEMRVVFPLANIKWQ